MTMEFGEAIADAEKPNTTHGKWHFWVYCCAWRLETFDQVLAYSEDARSQLSQNLALLEGKTLESVEIDLPGGDTVLQFEDHLILRLMPIHADNYEHWLLYGPEGVLTFGPGSYWQFEAEPET